MFKENKANIKKRNLKKELSVVEEEEKENISDSVNQDIKTIQRTNRKIRIGSRT